MEQNQSMLTKLCLSKLFVGGRDWVDEFCKENTRECSSCSKHESCQEDLAQFIDKIRIMQKSYLQLDNVSFLFGTGSSLHLGAKSIKNIPLEMEQQIGENTELYALFEFLVKQYQKKDDIERSDNEVKIPLEDFLNYLNALEYTINNSQNLVFGSPSGEIPNLALLPDLIASIKQALFNLCDFEFPKLTANRPIEEDEPEGDISDTTELCCLETDYNKAADNSPYCYHKRFMKSLLQRPLNLKRANIFTINYDLAFEKTFDELGVYYIDGFTGFHNRVFRPEVYEYDLYYPGSTTEGKVRRIERVVRYFKLHGSLSWIGEESSAANIYGLVEKPIDLIRQDKNLQGNIMIYPSSMKKRYTLDFPYSELFRHFSAAITQPQSVLFCIGYSFSDEHINDIIYQALAIPSFTLIIVDYRGTDNHEIKRLNELADPRVIILQGEFLGDFKNFSTELMPHFHEMDIREKVAVTLSTLYPSKANPTKEEQLECLSEP